MVEHLVFSQSLVLSLSPPRLHLHAPRQKLNQIESSLVVTSPMCFMPTKLGNSGTKYTNQTHRRSWNVRANVVSDSFKPTTFTVDSAGEGIDVLPDTGGSDDSFGAGGSDNGGGGGGDGDDGNNNNQDKNEGESNEDEVGKKKGMLMSQKITLGYAALVGMGGLMGYLKGGSQKSLIAGGGSAAFLSLVYFLLPSSPKLASCLGLGLSAALMGVMGSRFKKSGKIFPAGVVSLASLIMSIGYSHGIFRSAH